MDNPLNVQIEEISSKMIGDTLYHGKPVVLLDDAIAHLEELYKQLNAIWKTELDKARAEAFGAKLVKTETFY